MMNKKTKFGVVVNGKVYSLNAKRFISNVLVTGILVGGMFVMVELGFRAWDKEDQIRQDKIQQFIQDNEEAARENLGINYYRNK